MTTSTLDNDTIIAAFDSKRWLLPVFGLLGCVTCGTYLLAEGDLTKGITAEAKVCGFEQKEDIKTFARVRVDTRPEDHASTSKLVYDLRASWLRWCGEAISLRITLTNLHQRTLKRTYQNEAASGHKGLQERIREIFND